MTKRGLAKVFGVVSLAAMGLGTVIVSAQSGPGTPLAPSVEAINQARVATRVLYIDRKSVV